MKYELYPCFNWPGTIWLYSDPHFGDEELYTYRGTSSSINDDEQVRRINSKVGKNDTIVILGDVGSVEWVKKIRGYKVLILGNHDSGASKYKRSIKDFTVPISNLDFEFIKTFDKGDIKNSKIMDTEFIEVDDHLFDEVYTGCLMINEKIILSHEPVEFMYAFNIHGHDHSGADFIKYVLSEYDSDIASKNMSKVYLETVSKNKLNKLNVCAEWIGYYPVCLSQIIKSGALSSIPNIHRITIDAATERKQKKQSC